MDRGQWRLLIPHELRSLPADLAATLGLVVAVNVSVFLPIVRDTPIRIVLGLPFVLFIPGYAFIAALFPERGSTPTDGDSSPTSTAATGIDGIERVALSFGLSIAIVPLIGLVLNFTPFGIRLGPIMAAVSLFTVGATAIANHRRQVLPPDERFRVPYREWYTAAHDELFNPGDRVDAALNVLLVLSIVLAASSVAYAVAVPKQGEAFTEAFLLTETDDGELVADDYPTQFTVGESQSVIVGVSNHEFERQNYTVVVELQNATREGNTSIDVNRAVELKRFHTTLSHNETWRQPHTITPSFGGQDLRLAYLIYRGEPPETVSTDTAYRSLQLWINVTQPTTAP